jgi:hypothetical protein
VLSPLPQRNNAAVAVAVAVAATADAIRDENQVPMTIEQSSKVQRLISLDPGIRTFVTGYNPSGRVIEWGRGDIGRIYRLAHALDNLVSRSATDPTIGHHRRWRMRRAMARMRDKIRNLVDDLHRKLAKYLCEQYDLILVPEFSDAGDDPPRSEEAPAQVCPRHGHLVSVPLPPAPPRQGSRISRLPDRSGR